MGGEVVPFELPADDPARARRFYEATFGGTTRAVPPVEYTIVETAPVGPDGQLAAPGAINGGLGKREGPLAHPVVTIRVDDIAAAEAAIVRNGGKVVPAKPPIGDGRIGSAAYFAEPRGTSSGCSSRGGGRPGGRAPRPGRPDQADGLVARREARA